MAIVRSDPIVAVDAFVRHLLEAAASTVRVVSELDNGICTGWFLTPSLVVVPGYAVKAEALPAHGQLRVQLFSAGEVTFEGKVVGPPESFGYGLLEQAPDQYALGLLRVENGTRERVLSLSFDAHDIGDVVTLVHFPEGRASPCVSYGHIEGIDETLLSYDANTRPGSSGAPVLDHAWRVVAMHMLANRERQVNQGLTRAAMLGALRASRAWPEIADFHRIADDVAARQVIREAPVAAARAAPDPILVRAAISANLDRASLSSEALATLRPHVVDPDAQRWALRPSERRSIIAAVGSLDKLRAFRSPQEHPDVAEQVIDDILRGPPYDLANASEESLAWWIQAARWFEGVAPQLPTPAVIARELERRRIRSRLAQIAGPGFQGRERELKRLRDWYDDASGPLVLTGVGGIGKSALVARFVSGLPERTLLLWLDFDRADLAPDDAPSVLGAIAEQAAAQLEGFDPPRSDQVGWQEQARMLSETLASAVSPDRGPLLVLDSFEAAQYAERYEELWPVLEHLAKSLPGLRLIITGRAPVPKLRLRDAPPVSIHLGGLEPADVRSWLRDKGIDDPDVLDTVVDVADGIPLILRLAIRFVETGGRVKDLPRDLPQALVAGYLYGRILDRIQNQALKPLATGLLVLRRVTIDMIDPVLGGLVEFPPGEQAEWFAELAREMALVDGTDVLRLRPEVRTATLELLERDRPDFVRAVDERAATWYASNAKDDIAMAAELVYHQLRLGDVKAAERSWRDGCGAYLAYAADEIRDTQARGWLQTRMGGGGDVSPVSAWEQDAAERIRSSRVRKLDRNVGNILRERADRTNDSPLIFHEAYELRAGGHGDRALALLADAGDAHGAVGRDRRVLRALLLAEAGNRYGADELLARLQDEGEWSDRRPGTIPVLAIQAARVRLTVDFGAELALAHTAAKVLIKPRIPPVDLLLPYVRQRFMSMRAALEQGTNVLDIGADADPARILERVDDERASSLPDEPRKIGRVRRALIAQWSQSEPWQPSSLKPSDFGVTQPRYGAIADLAQLSWRRWWLVATLPFLRAALDLCKDRSRSESALAQAILGTLAIFSAPLGSLQIVASRVSVGEAIQDNPVAHEALRMPVSAWQHARNLLAGGVDPKQDWDQYRRTDDDGRAVVVWLDDLLWFHQRESGKYPVGPFILSFLAPDPLQQLAADLAGVSDRSS